MDDGFLYMAGTAVLAWFVVAMLLSWAWSRFSRRF